MRKVALVLMVLAAICFLLGSVFSFWGSLIFGNGFWALDPETYWRGATGLLLFAIALLLYLRTAPK
ncbi:MAG: hypothetical protein V1750_08030 [Acidobacteriota bacterium]